MNEILMLCEVLKQVSENDDLFVSIAKTARKLFVALMEQGFTREEALQLLLQSKGALKQ
jgi:transketolase N-terminal domain/subunit